MTEESQMRQNVRKLCSLVLYEDHRYLIGDKRGEDGHNLLVNDAYAFLDRGIFDELARTDAKRLESILGMVGERVLHEMRTENIPLEELGWALAKAAIRSQEEYASYLVSENRA